MKLFVVMKLFQERRGKAAERASYTLYVFSEDNPGKWERHQSFPARSAALRQARRLYRSGRYTRIEVKKAFDDGGLCQKTHTLMILDKNRNHNLPLTTGLATATGFLVLAIMFFSGG